jgi:excisionase family DNA binding protein
MTSPKTLQIKIDPAALPIAVAVAYSGLSRTRLYSLMGTGEIEAVKIGKRRLVLRKSIDEFIERQLRAPHVA